MTTAPAPLLATLPRRRPRRRAPAERTTVVPLENPPADLADGAAVLGERDELIRRHYAQQWMGPAQQCLGAGQLAVAQPVERLVDQPHLTARGGAGERADRTDIADPAAAAGVPAEAGSATSATPRKSAAAGARTGRRAAGGSKAELAAKAQSAESAGKAEKGAPKGTGRPSTPRKRSAPPVE